MLAVRQVLIGAWDSGAAIAATTVAGAGTEVAIGSVTSVTDTEVIVTTSLLWHDSYVDRHTDIYYVPDAEAGQYGGAEPMTSDTGFTISYDSYARSLSDVRAQANQKCQGAGMWAALIGRDLGQRMQSATFRCYAP